MKTRLQIILLLVLASFVTNVPAQEVSIPDPGLNAAIRQTLGKPAGPLTAEDLLSLTSLDAQNSGVSSLEGLGAAHNLTTLYLNDNQLSDVTSLAGLTNLTTLNLHNNGLNNLTLPADLTNLTTLVLYNNRLTSLTLPTSLTKLTTLDLRYAELTSLTLPAGLTTLTTLWLYYNQLTSLTLPADLTSLTDLDLGHNQLTSLTLPAGLTNLTTLGLGNNQLTSLTLPAGLTSLTTLGLGNNQLRSVTLPAGLTSLITLYLGGNQLTNVSFLNALTNLTTLDLSGNQLTRLTLPADLTSLTSLNLINDQLTSLTLPPGLTSLTSLGLYGNQLTNFSFLSGLTSLTTLDLGDNRLTSLTLPAGLTSLTSLDLYGNQLTNFSFLSGLTSLASLGLRNNQLTSLTLPAGLTSLITLYLSGNHLADFSFLSGLTNLTTLDLNANQLTSLTLPAGLTSLTTLSLDGNPLKSLDLSAGLTSLRGLDLSGLGLSNFTLAGPIPLMATLKLSGNQLTSLTLPSGLASLTNLDVSANQLTSLILSAGLTSLTNLDLRQNQLTSLTLPADLMTLTALYLSGNQLTNLTLPAGLTNLITLDLSGNPIEPAFDEIPAGLDYSFTPQLRAFPVSSLAVQADGKVLAAGTYGIVRLNPDGLLDTSFKPRIDGEVTGPVLVQSDGKILIGGPFFQFEGQPRRGVARLNPDGSLDKGFTANQTFAENSEAVVRAMALDETGRIIVAVGDCTVNGNERRSGVIRLNSDGSIDTSFAGPPDVCFVTAIVVQPDGRLLIAGPFSTVHGVNRNGVARLNSDGSPDLTFDPGTGLAMAMPFFAPQNTLLALQPDGRVLLAGTVSRVVDDEFSRRGIARLNSDGSVDLSFDPGQGIVAGVNSVVVQPDGKILVCGSFSTVAEQPRTGVARLNRDGSLDQDFKPQIRDESGFPDFDVVALQVQTDARILIGGQFGSVNGARRFGVARLEPASPQGINLGFSDLTYAVGEDMGKASISVQRFGDTTVPVSAEYMTSPGTAVPGKDYVEQKGTLMFAPHEPTKTFTIPIIDNALRDTNKTINLVLSQPTGGAALIPPLNVATITIYDNEQSGSVDFSFDASVLGIRGFLAVQADGKVLLGSTRLNADGTQDSSFKPEIGSLGGYSITDMLLQPDGKMVVVGHSPNNNSAIFRLNADGSVDESSTRLVSLNFCGRLLALQPDGKVIVEDCRSPSTIRRLNTDGSVDADFKPYQMRSSWLTQVAVSKDGKILLAGWFNTDIGLVRLNPNGSTDTSFKPQISAWVVYSFALHNDGKLVLIGALDLVSEAADVANDPIVRLNPDGSRDASFRSNARVSDIVMFAPAPDGKTVVGLQHAVLVAGAARRTGITRLNADGSLDADFDIGTGLISDVRAASVDAIAVQPDGQVLVAGDFISVNGLDRAGIVRLNGGGNYLKFNSLMPMPLGPRRLALSARPGRTYLLESSMDLGNWLPVSTQTATGFTLEFEDADAAKFPQRFYRATLVGQP